MTTDGSDAHKAVEEAARAARGTVADLAGVDFYDRPSMRGLQVKGGSK
jgi:tryptophan synthase beta chain